MAELEGQDKGRRRRAGAKRRGPIAGLNHVLRREILRQLHDAEGPRSPVRTAERLEHPLSSVSYHFKVLHELQAISPRRTAPVRGAVEHFYSSEVARNPVVVEMLARTREADERLMRDYAPR